MIEDFHKISPFILDKRKKQDLLLPELVELTEYHRDNCHIYSNYLNAIGYSTVKVSSLEDIPFLPIRVFKELELKSIPDEKVFKTMMSSGTSGQKQSRIYLDKETAVLQQKVLLRILGGFVGTKRLPMLVIDSPGILRDRRMFSTRSATVMALDFMAKGMTFALNDDMSLNLDVIRDFENKYAGDPFIIFGFTFMVWQHLFGELEKHKLRIDLSKGFLLTAGGWKMLEGKDVSNEDFKEKGRKTCCIDRYIDHYGMAEQTGCIYAECEYGHMHASIYSDVIIRDHEDFSPCEIGKKGFIQVLSSLAHSYPGHSILTEDEGLILGEDDCPCGRKGKYIKILGRMKNAEIRGCSNTYAAGF